MAAKVTLKNSPDKPKSLTIGSYKFTPGAIVYVTNPNDTKTFLEDQRFDVQFQKGKAPATSLESVPPPAPEDDEEPEEPVSDETGHTAASLKSMNKAELMALAAGEFDLTLDKSTKKDDLIQAILDAQNKDDDDDEEDEEDDSDD